MDEKKETQEPQKAEAEQKPEGTGEEKTTPESNNGKKHETEEKTYTVADAVKVLEENQKLLKKIEEERKRVEQATAEMLINGRSFGGQRPKEKSEDEMWAESAKERYAGTGLDPTEMK